MKILLLKSERGRVTSEQLMEGELRAAVTSVAKKALEEWDVDKSDFVILKDVHEIRKKLPLSPSLYEVISKYLKGKEQGEALAEVPVYIISFDNDWEEEDFKDRSVYLIAPYLDEESKNEMKEYAEELTIEETEETDEDQESEE
ncbi:hypothetical protein HS1genome_0111 [Sulfodiicoccus acidiphilus]|uniref:DUF2286 domain-containing protein n=1 Tax=Sulfodiicoccus acidiphilus TaxID=1670455 RepID=A0A348B0M0_9CREN|nr:DUF2286 domain-containing protein [Sulfodiicoccus acidiphilus]BBD71722.1 hypothetical protein HS1genome_0111 [Sulfodiicoccus acidiphilus]GGT86342.1 hypothetical protein GCM10007116_00350 [Sulfodiicoccus acidiphilus]